MDGAAVQRNGEGAEALSKPERTERDGISIFHMHKLQEREKGEDMHSSRRPQPTRVLVCTSTYSDGARSKRPLLSFKHEQRPAKAPVVYAAAARSNVGGH